MNLSNEQIKKILDEAPEGATHWWTLFNSNFINGNGFYGTYEEDVLLGVDLWNQIPLSDLRKQLEGEWVNGDIVIYKGEEWFYIGEMTVKMSNFAADCTIQHKGGAPLLVKFDELSKPETEAEKAEREIEEAESEITDLINSMATVNGCSTEEIAKAIVDKTKYRKEVE